MENIDLNIHNYDLNDLIALFKLPFHFKEEHLKDAKKIVLMTHPDKSRLDKEYFLFFSQAYKYLLKIHQLRQSSTTTNTDYDKDELWSKEHSVLIDGKIKTMSQEDYTDWFNSTFEKMRLKDDSEETGYGDWLKSDDDLVDETVTSTNEMNEYIQNKKKQLRALVVHNDFQDMNTSNGGQFDLVREIPGDYGSSMFDKLQFEDVRKAHCESVIPVTEEDFHNRKKYTNIDELNRERTQDMVQNNDRWLSSHESRLKESNSQDEDINIQRAYKLMNQDEMIRENHEKFWSDMKRIKN
ncbi:hypothetical protein N9895_01825 [Gammaproteobacteria bacterium]|jgi:hypothetical protein|nr:hypothetical protein [Gammaproteobacteria bacterium]|tara:strand:+ start:151 stop:1038 length:888 start_codon:yes stop_codon:yes gene_type:complete